jgi:chemotaxis protein MotB
VISLREVGFFDTGSARVKREALVSFGRIAAVLKKQSSRLRIEGHTDNVAIRNSRFESNWELSTARATEVVRLLTSEYRFDGTTLSASGYAEFHPVGDNRTSDGRRRNRRVDLIVLDNAGPQP